MAHMVHSQLATLANCQDIKVNTVDAFQGQEKKASSLFHHDSCLALAKTTRVKGHLRAAALQALQGLTA